jgi:phage-related protein
MGKYVTLFYEKVNGEEPAKEFLIGLDYKMRAKMIRMLVLLQENGPALRLPYSEELEDGIFELRVKFGTDISRMLYFYDKDKIIILTNGFIKKCQKTPKQEIIAAKNYREDYFSRKELK